jgi:hypothetical protein
MCSIIKTFDISGKNRTSRIENTDFSPFTAIIIMIQLDKQRIQTVLKQTVISGYAGYV